MAGISAPKGWAIFARSDEFGLLVLPGLKVNRRSTVRGASPLLHIKLDEQYVEKHVDTVLTNYRSMMETSAKSVRSLVHEIRGVNAAVKNAAYELNNKLAVNGSYEQSQEIKIQQSLSGNILALSDLLSLRMDAQDVVSAFDAVKSRPKERIPVYKKFDKVIRSLRPTVNPRNLKINLSGESHKYIFGPDMFEIVPYLMLENAVKYSLDGNLITCEVSEDLYNINCAVESFSPQIASDERDKIFSPGFRGKYAQQSGIPGDGLGLSILKRTVVSLYKGDLFVEVGDSQPTSINGILYCLNRFICRLPFDKQN